MTKGELNKAIDNMYKSNRIIVWNNGLAYYKGNSCLSLYTMLKKVKNGGYVENYKFKN